MKSENYYKKIESKWADEFPSTSDIEEVWSFYKECGYKNPQKTLQSILEKVTWTKGRILDFGCDTGFMLSFICDQELTLGGFGVDINTKAIEKAKSNFPNFSFQVFDGLNLPFQDKFFDLVFVSAVIKHVRYEDRDHIYSELNRVSDRVFFIDADSKVKEEVSHGSWVFYHSNFEKEFEEYFNPITVVREAGDILGLYSCS